jgi:SPP1 family predicted phage head-tail adaptor
MTNNPGQRKHLVSLQQREDITNAMNETIPNPNWVEVLELWASIEPLNGSEYNQAQQNKSKANLRINTIWYENFNASQSTNMRFVDKGDNRKYNVEYTTNPGQWHEQVNWYVIEDTSIDA